MTARSVARSNTSTNESIVVVVTDVAPGGANLRGGKGINLPDTELRLDALTAKDRIDLEFVAQHADIVSLSFVQRPCDVERLQDELARSALTMSASC